MSTAEVVEANFDGLPGPTHNFAGLADGNLASGRHAGRRSWPRQAALQSLAKMRTVRDLGLVQGILPPQARPELHFLRAAGYRQPVAELVQRLSVESPSLLAAVYSSSSMWTANAATVSAAADTADGRVHLTTANLSGQLHRAIEADATAAVLKAVFADPQSFVHHPPLPAVLADEGAANHTRLAPRYGDAGVALFAYGRRLFRPDPDSPRLPARQVCEASEAVARQHGLDPAHTVFARQLPAAVDAGVFHNDVICVGNRNLLFLHEQAFCDQHDVLARVDDALGGRLRVLEVPAAKISLERAVATYLFNAQLVSPGDDADAQVLLAPTECRDDPVVRGWLEDAVRRGALSAVHYLQVGESMHNGGGPACLRLRVAASRQALAGLGGDVLASDGQLDRLGQWIETHYPESLVPADLADAELVAVADRALAGVYRILGLAAPVRPD